MSLFSLFCIQIENISVRKYSADLRSSFKYVSFHIIIHIILKQACALSFAVENPSDLHDVISTHDVTVVINILTPVVFENINTNVGGFVALVTLLEF